MQPTTRQGENRTTLNPLKILDGGMGRELFQQGVPEDREFWSARALLEDQYHQHVVAAHLAFIEAGARFITTSNYGVIPGYFEGTPYWDKMDELIALSGKLARQASAQWYERCATPTGNPEQTGHAVSILGSLPPLVESYRHDLVLPQAEACAHYQRIIENLANYCDAFIVETLSGLAELSAAYAALRKQDKPFWVSFTLQGSAPKTTAGEPISELIQAIKALDVPPDAVLFNCASPEMTTEAVAEAAAQGPLPFELGAYANAFKQQPSESFTLGDGFNENLRDIAYGQYTATAERWRNHGCTIIGGCCGISPGHIKHLADTLR